MMTFSPQARRILDELRQDTQSGATRLALNTLSSLQTWVQHHQPPTDELDNLLQALAQARPSMTVIGSAMAKIQAQLGQPSRAPDQIIADNLTALENAGGIIVQQARPLIKEGSTVLTHSASSVVIRLFTEMARAGDTFSVICTQSSPGLEGHDLARKLNELKVPVTLITDAQMGLFVPRADLIITGCDCWLTDHHFVNKSGTLLLALAARYFDTPFWVLADSFRDSDKTRESVHLEEIDTGEMKPPEGRFIQARNIYFETIPETLITGRISEQSVFSFPAEPQR
jgi:translation initiation factor eIF-2B subunit delta